MNTKPIGSGERFHNWIQFRKLKKRLKKYKGIDFSDGGWYCVSDYGWEDCGAQGPMRFEDAVRWYFKQRCWDALEDWRAFAVRNWQSMTDHTGMHYITNESWRIENISQRAMDS